MGIVLVVAAVIVAGVFSLLQGPGSPLAAGWSKKIHELDVKVKMGSGEALIADLREIARLYVRLGKNWEAEQALIRALNLSKQQWGECSATLYKY